MSCCFSLHGRRKPFVTVMSAVKYPGPFKPFLVPEPPGRVKSRRAATASGSLPNRFGNPFLSVLVTCVWIAPNSVPGGVSSKFVGKLNPLLGLIGNPDRALIEPANCQSPITA